MNLKRLAAFVLLSATVFPGVAGAAWTEARSKHFIIYSEQKPADLQRYTEELERYDAAVRTIGGMKDPELSDSGRIRLYVLRSQADVAKLAGSPGSGIHGFYIPRVSGAVAFVHREDEGRDTDLKPQQVFFHEYLHHLMLSATNRALPLWVTEGTAEFFATARFEKNGGISFGHAPQYRGLALFEFKDLSTEEMVGATNAEMSGIEHELIYGKGWLLRHYLQLGAPARRGQLDAYLKAIQDGRTALDAAKLAFGDLRQLDRELGRYLSANRFATMTVPANAIRIAPVKLRAVPEAEAAALPVRMQSERGVNKRQARRVLGDAQRVARRFQTDPEVLTALAEAEQDAGNDAAAIAAADRAIAAAPNHQRALIMKSRALLSLAEKDPSKTDWKAVREVIGRANRIDPDAAEPLMLFYKSFETQGIAPTRNAVTGLMYALALVPQDPTIRLLAVRQAIADKKFAEARQLFGPIAYSPHAAPKRKAELGEVMTALNASDGGKAGQLLDKMEKDAEKERES